MINYCRASVKQSQKEAAAKLRPISVPTRATPCSAARRARARGCRCCAPSSYSARCETLNGATVLEIRPRDGAPTPKPSPTPAWGLHLLDANITLGNLIAIVKSEAAAFAARTTGARACAVACIERAWS